MSPNLPVKLRAVLSLLLLAAALSFSGCATGGLPAGGSPMPAKEVTVAGIRDLLAAGKFSEALQDSIAALGRSAPERSELERLSAEALSGLKSGYADAVESGDYRRALANARSLAAAGAAGFPSAVPAAAASGTGKSPDGAGEALLSESELLLKEADALLEDAKNPAAALTVFLSAVQADAAQGIGEREFARFSETAYETGSRAPLRLLVAEMNARGYAVPGSYRQELASVPPASEVVDGTAMILVNRGIRIQRGVGYPDRVIGSGFFIDPRGYLITNYHVISSEVDPGFEGYSRLFISLPGEKTRIPARVVGYDRVFDIALLKAETTVSTIFSFTPDDEPLDPGERIFAIGSPVGLGSTITAGIVSANGRRFLPMGDAVQIDVPINPGNSGGPLLNERRELVGYVFAGIEQYEGLNFAIPSHWVAPFLSDLYTEGEVVHPWMGAAAVETSSGLEISYLSPGTGAERAGLEPGDTLVAVNGTLVTTLADMQKLLLSYDPETLVRVTYRRREVEHEAFITLSERPFSPVEDALEKDLPENVFAPLFGMRVREAGRTIWGATWVVEKVYAGSVADETGLSVDDPFSIQSWRVLDDERVALLRIKIKKRKAGFLESSVQLGNLLDVDNFF